MSDVELQRLREARKAELQSQLEAQAEEKLQAEEQQQAVEQEAQVLSEAMRRILTPEARQRLARVELTRGEVALGVKRHLFNLDQTGNLPTPVDDETLKAVLTQLNASKRETTIRRI